MNLSEKEEKEVKRFTEFDKKWRKFNTVGGIISIVFSIAFIAIGLYFFFQLLPKMAMSSTGALEGLNVVYSLWCYTFILLGFSTFLSGFLMLHYCKDVHFLFNLYQRALGAKEAPVKKSEHDEKESPAEEPEKAKKSEG